MDCYEERRKGNVWWTRNCAATYTRIIQWVCVRDRSLVGLIIRRATSFRLPHINSFIHPTIWQQSYRIEIGRLWIGAEYICNFDIISFAVKSSQLFRPTPKTPKWLNANRFHHADNWDGFELLTVIHSFFSTHLIYILEILWKQNLFIFSFKLF